MRESPVGSISDNCETENCENIQTVFPLKACCAERFDEPQRRKNVFSKGFHVFLSLIYTAQRAFHRKCGLNLLQTYEFRNRFEVYSGKETAMPWCPVCKNEYQEGVTVCADCGAKLVEALSQRKEVLLASGPEELISRMKRFMDYNDIPVVFEGGDEEASLYVLPKHEEKAKSAAQVFLAGDLFARGNSGGESPVGIDGNETDQNGTDGNKANQNGAEKSGGDAQDETADKDRASVDLTDMAPDDIEEEIKEEITEETAGLRGSSRGGVYQKKSERAEELKSSGRVLLIFGILGCVVMLLIDFGILPIKPGNLVMMNIVMFALFALFFGFGVYSLKSAAKYRKESSDEEERTNQILAWASEHLTAQEIDENVVREDETEEIRFFRRTEYMKKRMTAEFGELEESYLDSLAETVYQEIFE